MYGVQQGEVYRLRDGLGIRTRCLLKELFALRKPEKHDGVSKEALAGSR